ncbi:MAG: pH-response regulator protein palH/rim21 [Bathelium mastoideum]|nr:MAG: pH-response regulator protein palH/rim21 [Bathelium mastoideum]
MLVITPRTFFVGGPAGGGRGLGGGGIIAGASSRSTSIVGVGSRPWLQKVAALTVAISLTLATSDTFKVAERQYNTGVMNASVMRAEVAGGMEIRITQVISDIFLWLAQVQTLIRLFPRHKEKVLIKWIGFALIVLDTVFSCLNSFMVNSTDRPRDFENAIPALSYLFQLALELLYGAWVLFYVATKRRYAFYHPKMKNICLVALLSLVAILTPVVFFVTDIAQPDVDGWGDYFRWVGAAAASVLVWEWVERIEALEREEKKDGILGREIFDGDEMLDVTPSSEVNHPGQGGDPSIGKLASQEFKTSNPYTSGVKAHGLTNIAHRIAGSRLHPQFTQQDTPEHPSSHSSNKPLVIPGQDIRHEVRPSTAVASPVSCADTTSAASTVYAVHYHPVSAPSPLVRANTADSTDSSKHGGGIVYEKEDASEAPTKGRNDGKDFSAAAIRRGAGLRWQAITNQFKRRRDTPPPEVRMAMENDDSHRAQVESNEYSPRWHVMSKLASLATASTERWRDKTNGRQTEVELPVTIIPAQPRGRTWSPGSLPLNDSSSERNHSPCADSPLAGAPGTDHPDQGNPPPPTHLAETTNPRQNLPPGNEEAVAAWETRMSHVVASTATDNSVLGHLETSAGGPSNTSL